LTSGERLLSGPLKAALLDEVPKKLILGLYRSWENCSSSEAAAKPLLL
jgi:hypothetical protein